MAIVGEGGERAAREALCGGADLVQVRAKHLSGRDLLRLVRGVLAEVGSGDRVLINSRPDLAVLTGCVGVHLPESGLNARAVREAYPDLVVGVSRHGASGIVKAAREGVHYILAGPVFDSPGKSASAMGVEKFRSLCSLTPVPLLAVGGITPEVFGVLRGAGARGIAAIRPFRGATDAHRSARAFKHALKYPLKLDLS